jgi:gluconolactonase
MNPPTRAIRRRLLLGLLSASVLTTRRVSAAQSQHRVIGNPDLNILLPDVLAPEGVTALPDGSVVLVQFTRGEILRWHPRAGRSVLCKPGPGVVGTTFSRNDGALYVAKLNLATFIKFMPPPKVPGVPPAPPPPPLPELKEPSPSAILRVDLRTGQIRPLYTELEGRELPAPNDLFVDAFGDLWCTDNSGGVYWARTDGTAIRQLISGVSQINGIALLPDRRRFVIVNEGRLMRYTISSRGHLLSRDGKPVAEVFAELPPSHHQPDGFKAEANGDLVCACAESGILVYRDNGELVEHLEMPGLRVVNLAFGGTQSRTAYLAMLPVGDMNGALAALHWPRRGFQP